MFSVVTLMDGLGKFSFRSISIQSNFNYSISCYIMAIFRFLNIHKLDKVLQTKYFKCIRRHILITKAAIVNRLNSTFQNNNQTRTFFRFTVGKRLIILECIFRVKKKIVIRQYHVHT